MNYKEYININQAQKKLTNSITSCPIKKSNINKIHLPCFDDKG